MKQEYENPHFLWITLSNDVIKTSSEGDDNFEEIPESGWTPGN